MHNIAKAAASIAKIIEGISKPFVVELSIIKTTPKIPSNIQISVNNFK